MLPDQRADEDVVWYTRQHWSRPLRRGLPPALLALIVGLIAVAVGQTATAWPPPWPLVAALLLLGLPLLAGVALLWIYLDWLGDAVIVTTQRIVRLRRLVGLHETRREIPLHRVQNVAAAAEGPLPAWLGYGRLVVESAGGEPLIVPAVPRPDGLRRCIFDLLTRRQARQAAGQQAASLSAVRLVLGLEPGAEPVAEAPAAEPATTAGPLIWHRHWWYLIAGGLKPALLAVLPLLALTQVGRLPGLEGPLALLLGAALLGLAVIGLAALVWAILSWRDDVYVIDGARLLDINRAPFRLRREVKETTLSRLQDVSYRIPGPLAYLLDFGDVLIETAGETQHFTFDGVARPRAVYAEVSRRLAAERAAEAEAGQQQATARTLELLGAYHRLTHSPPEPAEAPDPP